VPYAGDLGAALQVLRITRGLSQGAAADAAGLTKAMLSGYERGQQEPRLSTPNRLLDALSFTLTDLDAVQAFLRKLRSVSLGQTPSAHLLKHR
jgi:transcriptional regulator with XRE-family HTH domain